MQTTQDIIDTFAQLVDDTTELSTLESLALAQKVYNQVLSNRPWEFLKTQFTGATDGTDGITLPDDFGYLVDNQNYTDSSIASSEVGRPCVVFVGTNYQPYRVVNFSDRIQYRNHSNICWIDLKNNKLKFSTNQSSGQQVIFDYVYIPPALTLATGPVFPSSFWNIISFGMASDDMAIQLFDKAKSYAKEHQIQYATYLADMAYYNSQFNLN